MGGGGGTVSQLRRRCSAGFQVVAKGPTFTANLNLVTRGSQRAFRLDAYSEHSRVIERNQLGAVTCCCFSKDLK
jgi:hypothetical protein